MKIGRNFDYSIFAIVIILAMFGVVMVFSASYYTNQNNNLDGLYYFWQQLLGAGLGLAAMIILACVDYHIYRKMRLPAY
jgi:cell division protein FtsW